MDSMNSYIITYESLCCLCDCHPQPYSDKDLRFIANEKTANEMFSFIARGTGHWRLNKVVGDSTFEIIDAREVKHS